ncbi:Transcription factor IIB [Trypanosoma melophagium]|uniref:Transcription factor IIB n=1 Tax=Trypanosoma melophagium TaxID=715481 RepID=UPI003519EC21|nr:Transcription factor IIB [Trypanosoma melophagium]
MATTADFIGKNCPYCGAVDSLQADDALGEVACTECALVVAMGLEENALTRFNKDATYDDVDRHREPDNDGFGTETSQSITASALSSSAGVGGSSGVNVSKVTLHPAMLNCIRGLQKKSAVQEQVIGRAVDLAKHVVGGRRARGQRVERQNDIAAACFMIAAEQLNHPVPLAELRCLDASLGDVEFRRSEIVRELHMEEEERRLKACFVDNLLTTYVLKLGLQVSLYLPQCKRLMEAIQHVDAFTRVGTVDKIIMALLLSRTSREFQLDGKPPLVKGSSISGSSTGNSGNNALSTETVYANFAAKAHLDAGKVKKLMQMTTDNLNAIMKEFDALSTAKTNDDHNKKLNDKPIKSENDDNDNVASDTKRIKVEKV